MKLLEASIAHAHGAMKICCSLLLALLPAMAYAQAAPVLTLDRQTVKVGEQTTLTLNIHAARRGFMKTVNITVPKGVGVDETTTTVNVIGRGAVPLAGLSTQYMGRHGDAYSLNKVGEASVQPQPNGQTTIVLNDIDLRVLYRRHQTIPARKYQTSKSKKTPTPSWQNINRGCCPQTVV